MNLLLDTHVLIWVFSDDPRLSEQVKSAMANPDTIVFVSAVTAWEIAIKSALGKLSVPTNYKDCGVTVSHPSTLPQSTL
jgi:PIN domain nuclease of toxin-antitoxin system